MFEQLMEQGAVRRHRPRAAAAVPCAGREVHPLGDTRRSSMARTAVPARPCGEPSGRCSASGDSAAGGAQTGTGGLPRVTRARSR